MKYQMTTFCVASIPTGETCDMHYKNKSNYLLGEDIMKPGQGKAMRDMCHPSNFGE